MFEIEQKFRPWLCGCADWAVAELWPLAQRELFEDGDVS